MPKIKMEEAIKKIKAVQERISQIQNQAQQIQMLTNKFMGEQQDITSIGQIGESMYNQAMAR